MQDDDPYNDYINRVYQLFTKSHNLILNNEILLSFWRVSQMHSVIYMRRRQNLHENNRHTHPSPHTSFTNKQNQPHFGKNKQAKYYYYHLFNFIPLIWFQIPTTPPPPINVNQLVKCIIKHGQTVSQGYIHHI